uniref:Uncharacterized protein n=1 Tax=Hippocampus comes TaxID=109280 RepID=A0A3Q2XLV9_HIPCM
MTPKQQLSRVAAAFTSLVFLQTIPPVAAYDAGDALALLLGTVVAMVGFCAYFFLFFFPIFFPPSVTKTLGLLRRPVLLLCFM